MLQVYRLTALPVILFMSSLLFAQQKPPALIDPREAKEHFSYGNYKEALKVYLKLIKQEPDKDEFKLAVGLCYLSLNTDKGLAIPYFEELVQKEKTKYDVWLYLGQTYHYTMQFDKAIEAYEKYKEKAKTEEIEYADRQIEMCQNGKQMIKYPINVTYENIAQEVNSEFADYYPFVDLDEKILVFTTRRKGNTGNQMEVDGYYSSDIWYSEIDNKGKWSKPKNAGTTVNTAFDEQVVGFSPDGSKMMLYIDHVEEAGNLYFSKRTKKFEKREKMNDLLNSGFESSGSMVEGKDYIFFASDRTGGLGGTDIYLQKKLPNGQWALPQNLGPNINTKYGEDFPQLGADGKTLYFSSEGHSSMGSYDFFQSTWDEENNTWSAPKNLGYPISTTYDDRNISFTRNNRVAYLSAIRKEGKGDFDIYRVRFNDADQRYCIVTGQVMNGDSLNPQISATITALNMNTGIETTYIPIKKSGKYVMALEPGDYTITVESKGFEFLTEKLMIYEIGFQPEMKINFKLNKVIK